VSTPKRAMVVEAALVAPGVQRVRLRMSDGEKLGHRAGQYVLLHARAADGSIVKRAYSLASPPAEDPLFEFCVRLVPNHPASTFVHTLAPGDAVSFSGPWGKFVVDDQQRDLTLVATGTAISCTGAIMRDELACPQSRRVRLFWGLRSEQDAHDRARLDELVHAHPRFSYAVALSRPAEIRTPPTRVTDLLRDNVSTEALYYLAGNGAMIADAEDILYAAGVPLSSIRKEVFFTPGQVRVPLRERQARAANRERPGRAVIGLAIHGGTPSVDVTAAIEEALALAKLSGSDVRNLAAAAKASDEPGLAGAAEKVGLPVEFYLPAEVEAALTATGFTSACEALASASAGTSHLILPKHKTPSVTVAIAVAAGRELST
jgi:ferredoxin-NADP reductase